MTDTLEWTESTPRTRGEAKAFARPSVALVQKVIRFKLVLCPERFKRHQAAMQRIVSKTYAENLLVSEPNIYDNRHTYMVTALILESAVPMYEKLTGFKLLGEPKLTS